MNSYERLCAFLRGKPTDRLPVTLYGINPYADGWRRKDPSYAEVLKKAEACQDVLAWAPVSDPSYYCYLLETKEEQDAYEAEPVGDMGLLFSAYELTHRRVRRVREGEEAVYQITIGTPRGEISGSYRVQPGEATSWQVEPFVKRRGDIEKLLSLPEEVPDVSLDHFRAMQRRLGDRGMMLLSLPDPVGMVCSFFDYSDFLMLTAEESGLLERLLHSILERLARAMEEISRKVSRTIFRFWGAEYLVPPMARPELFERFVARYDRPLFQIVNGSGNFSCFHCHGKLKGVLENILSCEPHLLEPVEPPPEGDLPISELLRALSGRAVAGGYLQIGFLEKASPEELKAELQKIRDAVPPHRSFLPMTCAAPIMSLSPQLAENMITVLEYFGG